MRLMIKPLARRQQIVWMAGKIAWVLGFATVTAAMAFDACPPCRMPGCVPSKACLHPGTAVIFPFTNTASARYSPLHSSSIALAGVDARQMMTLPMSDFEPYDMARSFSFLLQSMLPWLSWLCSARLTISNAAGQQPIKNLHELPNATSKHWKDNPWKRCLANYNQELQGQPASISIA